MVSAVLFVPAVIHLRRPIQDNYTTSDRSRGFHYQLNSPAEVTQFVANLSAWVRTRGYTTVTSPEDVREIIGRSSNTYLIVARKPFDPSVPSYFYFTCRPKSTNPNQIDVTLGEKHYALESIHKRLLADGSHEFAQFDSAFPQGPR